MPVDGFTNLRRVVALRQAGRDLPPDLDRWLTDCLTRIVRGADPADVLGTAGGPGTRRPATRARYQQRDAALTELFALATGAQERRAGLILEWHDGTRPPPPAAVPLLEAVADAGLPLPDTRRVVEIATSAAARNVTASTNAATLAASE